MAKRLINNSYNNDKACGSSENVQKIQLSHIMETATTHATEYNKKWVFTEKYKYQQYICC